MVSFVNVLLGLIVALVLAIFAFKKQELTDGGTLAALFVGLTIFAFGGWTWLLLLILFFVSSNLLTRWQHPLKSEAYQEFAKGGARDFWQVLANGALPALAAIANSVMPSPAWFAVFASFVAASTADTWATEVGVMSKNPRLITTFKRVPSGTSGAVSQRGLLVAFAGALFIAIAGVLLNAFNNVISVGFLSDVLFTQFVGGKKFILIVAFAGFIGALVDSFLGASVQGIYYCDKCKKETEKTIHKCGCRTRRLKGFEKVDNDAVNFLSYLAAGGVAYFLVQWLVL